MFYRKDGNLNDFFESKDIAIPETHKKFNDRDYVTNLGEQNCQKATRENKARKYYSRFSVNGREKL